MTNFIFHPQASRELEESVAWYETQRPGLGVEFEATIRETLEKIADCPLACPKVRGKWRRALVSKFPYSIIYNPVGSTIYILSCFHTHRDPRQWKKRRL